VILLTQTEEDKRARRKARRERRKLGIKAPQVVKAKKVRDEKRPFSLYPVRVPYAPIPGLTFVQYKGSDPEFPECYRIYADNLHYLGIVHQNPASKKCKASQPESISKVPTDPRSKPRTFDNLGEAIEVLRSNYYRKG